MPDIERIYSESKMTTYTFETIGSTFLSTARRRSRGQVSLAKRHKMSASGNKKKNSKWLKGSDIRIKKFG